MKHLDIPVNIKIMTLPVERLKTLKPTRVLDIFDGGGNTNFHEEGLFSLSTFGRIGSTERDTRFSFIDLRTTIFHPFMYKALCQLKALYAGIMSGKAYAIWDEKEKDFVASDPLIGKTGYHFFINHWQDIDFKSTGSDIRDLRIKLIEKYKERALTKHVLIIPAGYRDVEIDDTGRVKQGEINEHYRALIGISNTISTGTSYTNSDGRVIDNSRHSMQMAFNRVYDYLNGLLEGKGGFFQQKWGARRIFYGTRNVITAMDTSVSYLGAANAPGINDTVLGLYQVLKGALPIAKYHLLSGWLSTIFNGSEGNAQLVNQTTLKRETVKVSSDLIDKWTTTSGIEKVINSYKDAGNRHKPVLINDRYVGLVYRGPDATFKIFGDIDELPAEFDKADVHPVTLCELLYLSGYRRWNTLVAYGTRYPVTGSGSIYPSFVYAKTTVVSLSRRELGFDWKPLGEEFTAHEYPVFDIKPVYIDSMVPHPSRLLLLGGDFDGDTMSSNILFTEEAIDEVHEYLSKAVAYVNPRGGLLASPIVETVERVLYNFTGD